VLLGNGCGLESRGVFRIVQLMLVVVGSAAWSRLTCGSQVLSSLSIAESYWGPQHVSAFLLWFLCRHSLGFSFRWK
jgi:hypothetical protein